VWSGGFAMIVAAFASNFSSLLGELSKALAYFLPAASIFGQGECFKPMSMLQNDEFGFMPPDDRLPLIYLRERRREMVLALSEARGKISREKIYEIAAIQQAIRAIETVIAE
jgi:hypothetical protein